MLFLRTVILGWVVFSFSIVVFKVEGYLASVSWWWVLAPVWAPFAVFSLLLFLCAIIALALFGRLRHHRIDM
jgi:hypothetical protein